MGKGIRDEEVDNGLAEIKVKGPAGDIRGSNVWS